MYVSIFNAAFFSRSDRVNLSSFINFQFCEIVLIAFVCGKIVPINTMEACEEWRCSFTYSWPQPLVGSELSASWPSHFNPGKEPLVSVA